MNLKNTNLEKLLKDIWYASRPLSLTLAFYSTTLGMVIANLHNKLFTDNLILDWWKIILVTVGGLAVQMGANFINDYFEGGYRHRPANTKRYKFLGKKRPAFDILIFIMGLACFGVTVLIGLYLIYLTSYKLLIIGILGVIGSYSYTGEPIVYKKRGLGTPLSFILMGPLMVYGAYLVFAEAFSWYPLILSLPVSFMIPALMLSNEIRDYKRDKGLGIKTLTVNFGYNFGKRLFVILIISSYAFTVIYVVLNLLPSYTLLTFITIPLAIKSYKNVSVAKEEGVPITNQLHLSFGLISILTMLLAK